MDEKKAAELISALGSGTGPSYWSKLISLSDPILGAHAYDHLIATLTTARPSTFVKAMEAAKVSPYLRQRLVVPFLNICFHEGVQKLQELDEHAAGEFERVSKALISARYYNNHEDVVASASRLYLCTGNTEWLVTAYSTAAGFLGWKRAVKPMLRVALTQSLSLPEVGMRWLHLLAREGERDEFEYYGEAFGSAAAGAVCKIYAEAQKAFWAKEYKLCLRWLNESGALEKLDQPALLHLAANAEEKSKHFTKASALFKKQNKILKRRGFDYRAHIETLKRLAALPVDPAPEDPYPNHFFLLSFPRSGTTLLENALDAHPEVQTAEETSSLTRAESLAYQFDGDNILLSEDRAEAKRHQGRYYRDIGRYVDIAEARCVIDKTPILAAHIGHMWKLFPNKKYLFPIRHPYDVVISNWKQAYHQNSPMSAFNEVSTACEFYDFTMSSWFNIYSLDSNNVSYIWYESLICNFEPTVRRAIHFLGVEWDDAVLDFAEHSKNRAVRTPSYANVRKGLSLGVQSSYQNYLFLFDDYCRSKLDPWVEFFGYTVEETAK